ncbi:hypothetical protein QR680_016336 [Steinernema hermaphroditum]|uniref:Uncharacterized protein n=1 Tax=Steinernema hermaphroditum TaxID=289476 RepID=A0AA39HD31_9BILA|nr:hypothetical protein QR680_016336 [Steinernema hermaphroditum]
MDLYLLHREKFNRLYNCDYLNQTEWENYAVQRPVMGWVCIVIGILYMSTYVPCLIVMSGPSFFKSSCYKIMFFLGIIDIICIWVNCFTTGFLMIHGSVYCMFPNLEFVAGAIAIGGWSGQCISCAILAINRCIDLWSAYWSEVLFSGRRTYIWISIAWIYMLYFFFFTNAVVYTSSAIMWFFDPYLTVPQDLINVDREQYRNWQHSANDYSLVSVMFVLYAFLIVSIRIKSGSITKNQIKVLILSILICTLNFIPSMLFAVAQFFPTPPLFVFVLVLTWQGGNGGAGLILLIFNQTLRRNVRDLVFKGKLRGNSVTAFPPSSASHAPSNVNFVA